MNDLKELYHYREMIISLVKKDLRTRYKGSALGFLWTFINPLFQLVIYSVAFSYIMRVNMPNYYIYMFVGLLPWMIFCASVQGGAGAIVYNADLVKKIYFPRMVLPIANVSAAFVNMLLSMLILFAALVYSGMGIDTCVIYLPFVLLCIYILGLGLAFVFSACNVFFRDSEHILGILLTGLFYVTPVIYPVSMIPPELLDGFELNPMFHMLGAFHQILYYQKMMDVNDMVFLMCMSVGVMIFGAVLFSMLEKRFAEEL